MGKLNTGIKNVFHTFWLCFYEKRANALHKKRVKSDLLFLKSYSHEKPKSDDAKAHENVVFIARWCSWRRCGSSQQTWLVSATVYVDCGGLFTVRKVLADFPVCD